MDKSEIENGVEIESKIIAKLIELHKTFMAKS